MPEAHFWRRTARFCSRYASHASERSAIPAAPLLRVRCGPLVQPSSRNGGSVPTQRRRSVAPRAPPPSDGGATGDLSASTTVLASAPLLAPSPRSAMPPLPPPTVAILRSVGKDADDNAFSGLKSISAHQRLGNGMLIGGSGGGTCPEDAESTTVATPVPWGGEKTLPGAPFPPPPPLQTRGTPLDLRTLGLNGKTFARCSSRNISRFSSRCASHAFERRTTPATPPWAPRAPLHLRLRVQLSEPDASDLGVQAPSESTSGQFTDNAGGT